VELRAFIGSGLLTSQDEAWQRQRRLVQPLFTRQRVAGYAGVMAEEAAGLVDRWRADAAAGRPVDLHAGSTAYALRVVGRLLFGAALDDVVDVLVATMGPLQRHVMVRGMSPVRPPRQWPTPGGRRARRNQDDLYAAVDAVLARARPDDASSSDLLTLLLRARDPVDGSALSRQEVRDQVLVFVLAGYETTANALAYVFHLLGQDPAVQDRVRAEAAAAASLDRDLPFTRQVVSEAVRLYPPVPHIPRSARRDDVVLGHAVRAGDAVLVPTWVVHRDPRWWPDPLRFDPGRFAPERAPASAPERHRYAYLPFGAGPRTCIGASFAMLEASVAAAAVARAFAVTSDPVLPPLFPGLTLRPRGPVLARLDARPGR
jgi:cytochrome P450